MAYKIKHKKIKGKIFKILIKGDNMYDKPFTEIVEIKAKTENEALKKADNMNGVYETELIGVKNGI